MRKFIWEFWVFGLKQASACIFGGFLLLIILLTRLWYPEGAWLYRYDFLFLCAVAFQVFLLAFKLEEPREAIVILLFHVVATGMEIFKTHESIGSWVYPEPAVLKVGNVPLFAGFMYSAVGSYIARVWRIFDFKFTHYPRIWMTVVLVSLIYINFFTHHFILDIRVLLLLGTVVLFLRCFVYFRIDRIHRGMPLLAGWVLVALFIWFAENIATYANVWIYPNQSDGWKIVPLSKLMAWFLLMILSFVLVSLVQRPVPFVRGLSEE